MSKLFSIVLMTFNNSYKKPLKNQYTQSKRATPYAQIILQHNEHKKLIYKYINMKIINNNTL